MNKTTAKKTRRKPTKPSKAFPLFPHANGSWAKKIRGRMHYFGGWDDPEAALRAYRTVADDLHAGRPEMERTGRRTVADLCNRFLASRRLALDAEEIVPVTLRDYQRTCGLIIAFFGGTREVETLAAEDFERFRVSLAGGRGPVALGNAINRVRIVFRFAYENRLIEHPMRFGSDFKRPGRRRVLQARNAADPRMFEADEIRRILETAPLHLKCMTLLGINCGFGNMDCAGLPISALDMETGWVSLPRSKTGIPRRCPIWAETVAALRESLDARKPPRDPVNADLVFLTRNRGPWGNGTTTFPLSQSFRKLLVKLGIYRRGRGFYGLRHSFETLGGDSRDQVAVNHIMGHADRTMAAVRERIEDDRLVAVTDHVRQWLFAATDQSDSEPEQQETGAVNVYLDGCMC